MRAAGAVEGCGGRCGEPSGCFIAGQVVPSAVPNWRAVEWPIAALPPTWPVPQFFPNVGNRNWDRSESSVGAWVPSWGIESPSWRWPRWPRWLLPSVLCGGFAVRTLDLFDPRSRLQSTLRCDQSVCRSQGLADCKCSRIGSPCWVWTPKSCSHCRHPHPDATQRSKSAKTAPSAHASRDGTKSPAGWDSPSSLGADSGRLAVFYHAACTTHTVLVKPGMSSSKCQPLGSYSLFCKVPAMVCWTTSRSPAVRCGRGGVCPCPSTTSTGSNQLLAAFVSPVP